MMSGIKEKKQGEGKEGIWRSKRKRWPEVKTVVYLFEEQKWK